LNQQEFTLKRTNWWPVTDEEWEQQSDLGKKKKESIEEIN